MKRLKKYFLPALVFSALALLFSCNADKLELTNPNEMNPATFFANEAQVRSAVNSIYGSLQTVGLYNRTIWYANENMAHESTCNPQQEADKRQWLNFSFPDTHTAMESYWEACYRGINKANFVINNSDKINNILASLMSQERKDKYIGEAKFMRALYYFYLVTKFGAVPLYLETPEDQVGKARTPAAQVWAQIEADAADAAAKCLPKASEDAGRATSGAAWALLGKARLYQGKYAEALDAFNNIAGYDLEPVFYDNFKEETENGIESLFEVQFSIAAGYSNQWASDRTDAGLNEATFRGQEYGCLNWFNVFVSQDLWDEFETVADNGVKADPRRGYSAYQTGDLYNNNTMTMVIDSTIVLDRNGVMLDHYKRRGWKKYQNYYKASTEGAVAGNESGINMKVIRLADVYLMMAECYAKLATPDWDNAIDYLNRTRQRGDVQMPLYDGTEMNAIYPNVRTLAGFMKALEHERKVELCGEQVRFDDLVRWGRLEAFMTEVKPSCPKADQDALVFRAPKNLLWPIPFKEVDSNPNIAPEDNNPGWLPAGK